MKEEEKQTMSVIVMDNITGGWLLFPRSKQYFNLKEELQKALNSKEKTTRQSLIVEEYTRLKNDINKITDTY